MSPLQMRDNLSTLQEIGLVKQKNDHPSHILRGDYIRMLDNWSSHFDRRQIFVGFFDDIASNPEKIVTDILRFLEIDTTSFQYGDMLTTKKNVSIKREISEEIEQYLAQKYQPMLETLADKVGGHAVNWLAQANQIIEKSKVA
ncbi:MAG: sulfotransferase domain-containing protein [Cyanobacteria bacterium J06560_6]